MDVFPDIRIPFSITKSVEWGIIKSDMINGSRKRRSQWVRPKHKFTFKLDALKDYGEEEAEKIYHFFLAQMGGLRAFKFFFPTEQKWTNQPTRVSSYDYHSVTGEVLGTGDGTTTTFSGNLSNTPVRTSYTSIKYTISETQLDELLGTGDGTTTTFSGTYANTPLDPGTISIDYTIGGTTYTATDDGAGNISGTDCTGTVNYTTGDWSLTFTTAPDSGTNITSDYNYLVEYTATDDGNGNISGTYCTGTLNYDTGAYSLTYSKAPANGYNITADYQWFDTILQIQVTYGSDYSNPVTVDQEYIVESSLVVYKNGTEVASSEYTVDADAGTITINIISTDTVTVDYYRYYAVVFSDSNIDLEMFKWKLYNVGIVLEEDI